MPRSVAAFYDPTGARHGLPTYPWGMAPAHLATRRQLAARGLRPGGQQVVAQVLWRSRRYRRRGVGVRAAYLYDVRLALPKRTATPAQRAALDKALQARRTCPECGTDPGYVLSRRLGVCLDCDERSEVTDHDLDAWITAALDAENAARDATFDFAAGLADVYARAGLPQPGED